ncbi:MAG: type II secretion system F family protein [Eubacterium sp.]|nr:type II secretion system F family protein [Eubacterium sp.]
MRGEEMYVVGCMAAVCYLALFFLSRKETVEQDISRLLAPFYRMAVWIYKRMCIHGNLFFSSAQVEKDLRSLYPGQGKEYLKANYYIKKISLFLAVLFVGTLFGMLVRYNSQSGLLLDEEGKISRGDYREGSVEVRLKTDRMESEGDSFQIEVAPMRLTEEEIQALSEELWNRLPEYILGENEALDRVSSDLTLEESYGDHPFLLEWKSSSPAVVGSTGRVYPVEKPVSVELTVRISYGEDIREKILPVTVVPKTLTAEERTYAELNELLQRSEYDSRGEEAWKLPDEWQGGAVSWQQEVEDYSVILWALAIVTAVSVYVMSDQDLHRQQEQRKKQMQKDYPDIVHKLALYIGAGMTSRSAFQKITEDYERKKGAEQRRPAYEEMLFACRELRSGVSEASAYEHFGKRTGLQEYIRLSTLLIQNLKKGNSTLLERLGEEADRAGEERLQNCRRLGEEAGTKLLVPMVLMLLVVMVMIMIPAFSAM